jgi:DNA-binding transcriptional LysR family regulator
MDVPWDDLRLVLAVAEAGSLSRAARALRTTQPTVSRRLAELEARLGEPLFVRAAAGAHPTALGERLLSPARQMAEWAAEAERAIERRESRPRGIVRVTAPPGIASDLLVPFAAAFRRKFPEIRLEIVATVRYVDLSRREADLALRVASPQQRDVEILITFEHAVRAFAAPTYAERLPKRPKVEAIDWIGWAPPLDHLPPNPQLAAIVPGFRPAFASDDFLVQVRAAEAGLGAIFLGRVRHRFSPERPALVELDVDLGDLRSTLHLACAKSALSIPRVRAVADALVAEFEIAIARSKRPISKGHPPRDR